MLTPNQSSVISGQHLDLQEQHQLFLRKCDIPSAMKNLEIALNLNGYSKEEVAYFMDIMRFKFDNEYREKHGSIPPLTRNELSLMADIVSLENKNGILKEIASEFSDQAKRYKKLVKILSLTSAVLLMLSILVFLTHGS